MTRRFRRRALTLILATSVALSQVTLAAHADPRPASMDSIEAWQQSTSVRLDADGSLSDVLALASGDVWAVGQQEIWDVWKNRGTIRHWNGDSWSEVPVRDATTAGNLRGIAAASPNDVWAVGDGRDGLPYLAHGGITGFDRVRADGLRAGDWLGGISAEPGRVVAVGSGTSRDPAKGNAVAGLIVTGQNGRWTVQETADQGALYAVSAGFAVGDTGTRPLIVHRSGDAWKTMKVPDIPGGYLRDVQVDSAKRALAVGGVYHGPDDVEPLVLSWNGKRWQRIELPGTDSRLYGVTGDGKGRYWISGYDPSHAAKPFMLRCEKDDCAIIRGGAARGRNSVRLQAVTYLAGKGAVWAVGHAVDATDRYTDVVESFGPREPLPADS
ncbi:hypothetical protein [Nonomuraea cavernae]|uniref:hypothetical protein n=1 Tax=Nonomuraea cavernae TaxID=2045107 RepID=UPI001CDA0E49|nr:hypothetical protein [Nonomuraea cavernae]MCA2188533.1 hypothetical protein [Nonomuraea cavernae]